jgi:hypothetical protein
MNTGSSFTVEIKADSDTIASLLAAGTLGADTVAVLPQSEYELTAETQMESGKRVASFMLKINLDFLSENAADKRIYAIGVNISCADCPVNADLSAAIILIYPDILHPAADFSYRKGAEERQILFSNVSAYYTGSQWEFGDGSVSAEANPGHVFAAAGTYPVKLTVTGISGLTSEKTIEITVE